MKNAKAKILGFISGVALVMMLLPSDAFHFKTTVVESVTETEFDFTEKVKLTDDEKKCLALNIYHEAGVEDHDGKVAVGQVTLNRVRSGRWGDDVCDVVYAKAQFSWTLWEKNHKVMPKGPLWEKSLVAVQSIIEGEQHPELTKVMFYHTDYIKKPRWADDKYKVVQIGQHIFYNKAKQAPAKKKKAKVIL
jgi:N-acetylmuramoyl-L-alanine amidase